MTTPPAAASSDLFVLTLPAQPSSLPMARALVDPLVASLGFGDRDAYRVHLAVEEACANVIAHAYAPGQMGDFTLRARVERSSLVLSVEDRGLPRDPFAPSGFSPENPEAQGLGTRLLEGMTDEVRYLALGRGGKAIEMLIRLPAAVPEPVAAPAADTPVPRIAPESLRVRAFQPQDAGQIAQCAYRCYDYSYVGEALYVPERVIEMNRTGEMVSVVAEGPDGRIYGHAALLFSPGAPAPESGCAFVVPEARGGGTFVRLKRELLAAARERGAPGVWSEAVTNHPASQRANIELAAHETGMLFGIVPTSLRMRNLPGLQRRGSLLLFYVAFEDQPVSRVCLPPQHRQVLEQVYARMGFALDEVTPAAPPAGAASTMTVSVRPDVGLASMRVQTIGADLADVVRREITRACDGGARTVLLDLPAGDPALPDAVAALEQRGCHFAGIIPRRYPDGDSLRLTYLDHVQIDVGALRIASPFGQTLCDYLVRGLSAELLVRDDTQPV